MRLMNVQPNSSTQISALLQQSEPFLQGTWKKEEGRSQVQAVPAMGKTLQLSGILPMSESTS